ncbi:phage tail protein [Nguyenibacter vanlangensis]|uniref:Phage tail protein n=1 Tax=Nguyenibacter vanlangensis TaxID=1216886 RepID=A0A7Y7ITT6_9PROT|nr:tail fiber protein [Nguyenibacter vanlangensis]NVN10172.1 phage tail protein [Nguyenibacter vanlangensis]
MAEGYLGEIRIVPYLDGKVPQGWHVCDGTLLQIGQNAALYSLLGTAYGGDGRTTFALPDLRGRAPISQSDALPRGTKGGKEMISLTMTEMPAHNHTMDAYAGAASQPTTANAIYAESPATTPIYGSPTHLVSLSQGTPELVAAGAGQAHENRQPYTTLNYIICVSGMYPPHP